MGYIQDLASWVNFLEAVQQGQYKGNLATLKQAQQIPNDLKIQMPSQVCTFIKESIKDPDLLSNEKFLQFNNQKRNIPDLDNCFSIMINAMLLNKFMKLLDLHNCYNSYLHCEMVKESRKETEY